MSDQLEKCDVCRAMIDEEDLFCANCGTEAPQREGQEQFKSVVSTHSFHCEGCGASMSYSANAGTLRCPFCGSEKLEKEKEHKTIAPDGVIPFEVDQSAAEEIMRNALGKGFWRPGDLSEAAVIEGMRGVYVPYWVFQASVKSNWVADTNSLPFGSRGDWRPLAGEHQSNYSGLLVGASGALTPSETSNMCPFHLDKAEKPDADKLDEFTIETFNVSRKYARPMARRGLEQMERQACDTKYVPGKSRNVKVNMLIEDMASRPMLLPVWIMAYRYEDQLYRFLVNGQTGKSTGQAPTSYKKVFAAVLIAVAVVIGILVLIGLFSG
jgi:predicted RNA-binding Zn-ribbon protein involved in translation (DUF1610 family)